MNGHQELCEVSILFHNQKNKLSITQKINEHRELCEVSVLLRKQGTSHKSASRPKWMVIKSYVRCPFYCTSEGTSHNSASHQTWMAPVSYVRSAFYCATNRPYITQHHTTNQWTSLVMWGLLYCASERTSHNSASRPKWMALMSYVRSAFYSAINRPHIT